MKTWTDSIRQVKIALLLSAIVIAVVSLIVSHRLIRDLQHDELEKMEVWAEAMRSLNSADENADLNLVLKVINGNNSIPILVTDREGHVTTQRNLPIATSASPADSLLALEALARDMMARGDHMTVTIAADPEQGIAQPEELHIYYQDSLMLRRLALFPYVQLGVVGLFVAVAVFALLTSKRAEQNRVWVGLSKETAHQLGTPISSLMAWTAVLEESYPDDEMIAEMKNDVARLQLIADRFSKIGSVPPLVPADLADVVCRVVEYIRRRSSSSVTLRCHLPADGLMCPVCAPLIEWVVEVLCKNAIDAMSGAGTIDVTLANEGKTPVLEIADTGKGIQRKHFKTVFKPGFTTKKRGWGLGLSLAKRIVEEYHHGRIFVKSSEVGKGTTFRIELRGQA